MNPIILILCIVGAIALLAFAVFVARMKAEFAVEAKKLTKKDLSRKVVELYCQAGEKFSLKTSVKLSAYRKEELRRNLML